jgi:hypothetical protein
MGKTKEESAYLKLEKLQTTFSLQINQYKTAYTTYINEIAVSPNSARAREYLANASAINAQLRDTHGKILTALENVNASYQSDLDLVASNKSSLGRVYSKLKKERGDINQLLKEYNTLEHVQTDAELQINSNMIYYRILIIICAIIAVLIVKQFITFGKASTGMVGGGKGKKYDMLFNFIIMILLLFLANAFQHSSAYILWSLFVLAFVVYKMKLFNKTK